MFTHDDLVAGFAKIELTPERVVMVHSSYKSLGGVDGGAEAVVDALRDVVGPSGTCVRRDFRVITDIAPGMDELFEKGIIRSSRENHPRPSRGG